MATTIVTGAAGFVGAYLSKALLDRGHQVVGVDNLNDYYDPGLKRDRLEAFCDHPEFQFQHLDISDSDALEKLFAGTTPEFVFNMAAQAGVRHSIEHPHPYAQSNLVGFLNVLEGCRHHHVKHLIYASSSSVYGANAITPFAESAPVDHPLSLYAATKRANELMAHSYSHLYKLPCTGLRLFTVYGPWGRPDMAPILFTRAMMEGRTIEVFNGGDMLRDFTYIDDIIGGILKVANRIPESSPDRADRPDRSHAPFRVYNLGHNHPTPLMDFIHSIEKHVGVEAKLVYKGMQPGDMQATYADSRSASENLGFDSPTHLDDGVAALVAWCSRYLA
jgi:UDP-glucuronate 4-epimerase